MNLVREIRELFTPYELAAAAVLINVAALIGTVLLMATEQAVAVAALVVLDLLLCVPLYFISRCPTCGKSPLKFFLTNRERGFGSLLFVHRWWPERECSSCRTSLDVI